MKSKISLKNKTVNYNSIINQFRHMAQNCGVATAIPVMQLCRDSSMKYFDKQQMLPGVSNHTHQIEIYTVKLFKTEVIQEARQTPLSHPYIESPLNSIAKHIDTRIHLSTFTFFSVLHLPAKNRKLEGTWSTDLE